MKHFSWLFIIYFSCTPPPTHIRDKTNIDNYNKPFVSPDQTTKLEFDQSKTTVLNIMGDPLFIDSGGNNTVVWVYVVRTINVMSVNFPNGITKPNKTHDKFLYDKEHHYLALTFTKDKLSKWGHYENKDEKE